ncbi:MAG: hypothetical protein ABIQ31_02725 [Ferruginibacter sp.]
MVARIDIVHYFNPGSLVEIIAVRVLLSLPVVFLLLRDSWVAE